MMKKDNMRDVNSKLILVVTGFAGVALLIGFLAFFQAFRSQSALKQPVETKKDELVVNLPEANAELALLSGGTAVKVGEEFSVDLLVDAKNEAIHGIDAVINYDPAVLQAVRVEEANERFIFPRKMLTEGTIIITALTDLNGSLNVGREVLAKIVFRAVSAGQTNLSFDFQKGSTVGSTVIEATKSANILTMVTPVVVAVTN